MDSIHPLQCYDYDITLNILFQTPGTFVNLGSGAINTVSQVPATAFRATGNALRAGANVLTRTPTAVGTFADSAVSTGNKTRFFSSPLLVTSIYVCVSL